jgi:hypothetical protein
MQNSTDRLKFSGLVKSGLSKRLSSPRQKRIKRTRKTDYADLVVLKKHINGTEKKLLEANRKLGLPNSNHFHQWQAIYKLRALQWVQRATIQAFNEFNRTVIGHHNQRIFRSIVTLPTPKDSQARERQHKALITTINRAKNINGLPLKINGFPVINWLYAAKNVKGANFFRKAFNVRLAPTDSSEFLDANVLLSCEPNASDEEIKKALQVPGITVGLTAENQTTDLAAQRLLQNFESYSPNPGVQRNLFRLAETNPSLYSTLASHPGIGKQALLGPLKNSISDNENEVALSILSSKAIRLSQKTLEDCLWSAVLADNAPIVEELLVKQGYSIDSNLQKIFEYKANKDNQQDLLDVLGKVKQVKSSISFFMHPTFKPSDLKTEI